jgi:hypothetical protein
MAKRSLWPNGRPDSYAAIHRGPHSYRKVEQDTGPIWIGQDRRDGAVYIAFPIAEPEQKATEAA